MALHEQPGRGALKRRLRGIPTTAMGEALGPDRTIQGAMQVLNPRSAPDTSDNSAPISYLPSIVTLDMFNTKEPATMAPLVRHYVGRDIDVIAALSNNKTKRHYEEKRKKRYLKYHPDVTSSEYAAIRADEIKAAEEKRRERINKRVYTKFQEEHGLQTLESAALVFENQRQEANKAVEAHAKIIYPDDVRTEQRNEVDLEQKPSDLIKLYFGRDSDPLLRSEIQRQALLTTISSQIEQSKKGGADAKLAQIQSLLNEHLYDGPVGSTTHKDIYGKFKDSTNELVTILEKQPTEPAQEGNHYKRFDIPMRKLKGTGKFVLTKIGAKERPSALSKVLDKAKKRSEEGEGKDIRHEDIEDTHRIMLVVSGTEQDAQDVIEDVFSILIDNRTSLANQDVLGNPIRDANGRLTGLPEDFLPKNATQNGKVDQYRINMIFSDLAAPIEIIVRTMKSYLNADHEVGTFNARTGNYTGIAHPFYKFKRETGITDYYFSEESYPQLIRPNSPKKDSRRTPHKTLTEIAQNLREKAIFIPKLTDKT